MGKGQHVTGRTGSSQPSQLTPASAPLGQAGASAILQNSSLQPRENNCSGKVAQDKTKSVSSLRLPRSSPLPSRAQGRRQALGGGFARGQLWLPLGRGGTIPVLLLHGSRQHQAQGHWLWLMGRARCRGRRQEQKIMNAFIHY